MTPAGLPRRYAAWSLDAALLATAAVLLCLERIEDGIARCVAAFAGLSDIVARSMWDALRDDVPALVLAQAWLRDPAWIAASHDLAAALAATLWPPTLAFAAIGLLYHALFESSAWQATPGKRMLGLRVVGDDGARIGPARAATRQAAGALSWLSLNIGHALAALPPRHRALHDMLAGAHVVQRAGPTSLPTWAKAWLWLQACIALLATGWLLQKTNAALVAAFDALLA